MTRRSSWLLTALTVAIILGAVMTRGQQSRPNAQTPQTDPKAQSPQPAQGALIDPEAMTALKNMAAYLRTLKAFQVEATTSTEQVLVDGQKVQFDGVTSLLARMPDRLRIEVHSDRRDRLWVYDGKQFSMLAQRVNYYATIPAPATIAQLADMMDEKYAMDLPLEDLFRWGGPKSEDAAITSAMLIGPSAIQGVSCGHYAFRQEGLDWQVWIQRGDAPLPRKLVLTTLTDEARPQYIATFTWNLAPAYEDAAFTFVPPKDAGRVVLDTGK
jgi:hypothetical protein